MLTQERFTQLELTIDDHLHEIDREHERREEEDAPKIDVIVDHNILKSSVIMEVL